MYLRRFVAKYIYLFIYLY